MTDEEADQLMKQEAHIKVWLASKYRWADHEGWIVSVKDGMIGLKVVDGRVIYFETVEVLKYERL